jgi:hypothetical protein
MPTKTPKMRKVSRRVWSPSKAFAWISSRPHAVLLPHARGFSVWVGGEFEVQIESPNYAEGLALLNEFVEVVTEVRDEVEQWIKKKGLK